MSKFNTFMPKTILDLTKQYSLDTDCILDLLALPKDKLVEILKNDFKIEKLFEW